MGEYSLASGDWMRQQGRSLWSIRDLNMPVTFDHGQAALSLETHLHGRAPYQCNFHTYRELAGSHPTRKSAISNWYVA
jgi:hypothetical protein